MSRPSKNGDVGRDATTFIALFGLLLLGAGFIALTALVLPNLLVFPLVFFAFVFVCAFHYLTWGRWMSRMKPPLEEDERGSKAEDRGSDE